jgi:SAM-dependent methyltransferase
LAKGRALGRVRKQWERWGDEDPWFGVLARDGGISPEDFFAEGRNHVAWAMTFVEERSGPMARGAALDFGSGLGRLTAPLAVEFDEAIGVDVSEPMVARARELHPEGPTFVTNDRTDLSIFPDGRFDFVLSYLVLQHMPKELELGYIAEFVRVLAPGGRALFQAHEGFQRPERLLDSRIVGPRLRNLLSRAKSKVTGRKTMEIHVVSRDEVSAAVTAAGGEVVAAESDWTGGDWAHSVVYLVRKP